MSQVKVTISTQAVDFNPNTYGKVELELRILSQVYRLDLTLSPVGGYLKFKEILWVSTPASDEAQAVEYANSIIRDFKATGSEHLPQTGSTIPKNINASVSGNEVTITAQVGTFHNGNYTGDRLSAVVFDYTNTVQETPKTFSYEPSGVGSCTTEQYTLLSATGGSAPYTLRLNGVNVVSGWDGAVNTNFDLDRVNFYSGSLVDSLGQEISAVQINPTKNILASHFNVARTVYTGYVDLVVETLVSVSGSGPLEYNLYNNGVGLGWQSSNVFGGVTPGLYEVRVRDKYECEVAKTVEVQDITTPLEEGRTPFFAISEFNSLSFYNEVDFTDDVRSNYLNTPTEQERVQLKKRGIFEFPVGRRIKTQFWSSYPYHAVTLNRANGSKVQLPFFKIQENLGVTEKVDCVAFSTAVEITNILTGGTVTIGNGTGFYFNGGNEYQPNSTTVKGDSPYLSGLPPWAKKGNLVSIDGFGTYEIKETGLYNEDLDVIYFRIDEAVTAGNQKIQSSWDRHPYNVFRVDFDMSYVGEDGAFLRIEPGVLEDGVLIPDLSKVHRSIWFRRITDTSKYLKVTWNAFKNIGYMLFADGITCEMWVKGRLTPYSETSSETDDTDDRTRSLDQEAYLRMRGFFPLMSVRHWRKLDLAGSIGNRGHLYVEGLEVLRISPSEQEEQGVTNLSNVTVEMAFAGEPTSTGQGDPVYSVDTGSENTPGDGTESITGWEAENNRVITEDGLFVKVIDDGIEKYVEID